jgi:hypothetical protein
MLASSLKATEALEWYRKAAAQGSVEGKYNVGHMLLFGAPGLPANMSVQPKPAEGIRWTFMAATNSNANAWLDMSKALRQGIGTSTNLTQAYAWLSLYAKSSSGLVLGQVYLNELALQMDTRTLQQAQNLAEQFRAGKWQPPSIPETDPRLKLGGISFGSGTSLAMINGKTLAEGESATVTFKTGTLNIKCLKIQKDSVLIAVEGEDNPRLLHSR